MPTPKTKTTTITVEILINTPNAVFVSNGNREKWIPKSEIIRPTRNDWENIEAGNTIAIQIPKSLAVEKELV